MKKRSLLLLCVMLACFSMALFRLDAGRQAEGLRQLEAALRRAAVSCYAAEGFYPPSLEDLLVRSGLTYDGETYLVHYEAIASNLMPEITVLERLP